jgi:hypothetical protein
MRVWFPTSSIDIIDNVIEAVGDDKPLLKQCALVSSSLVESSYSPELLSKATGDQ